MLSSLILGIVFFFGNVTKWVGADYGWDTMFAITNLESTPITARITLIDETTGQLITWPETGLTYFDQIIQPGAGWAASFEPGNGFGINPPSNFNGHATVEFIPNQVCTNPTVNPLAMKDMREARFYCHDPNMLAWGALGTNKWHDNNASVEEPITHSLTPKTIWNFAYAIPQFIYAPDEYSGGSAFITGITVQNFSSNPATITITYIIYQTYVNQAGQRFSYTTTIPGNQGLRTQLDQILQGLPVMSEGYVTITSTAPSLLLPSLVIATSDYLWSVLEMSQ